VTRGWYEKGDAKHPWKGETKPIQGDPEYRPADGQYSWFKAPRYEELSCEVGPLARVLVAYAKGHKDIKPLVDSTLQKLDVPVSALFSTLGRTAARGLETVAIGNRMETWMGELLANVKSW
jgi:[NiFe] hydrogenase large subunit